MNEQALIQDAQKGDLDAFNTLILHYQDSVYNTALRILVDDIANCYAALGVVHSTWSYIAGEFDDYIASPKGNHYQSLHTAVIDPHGKTLEVQIRTHEMHRHAELGFAAHWRYKEVGGADASFERKIAWMRQLLESKDAREDDAALLAGFRTEVIEDRVYLLTPKGLVVDLPRGATVVFFAEDKARWVPGTRYIRTARPDTEGKYRARLTPGVDYLAVVVRTMENGQYTDPAFLETAAPGATRLTIAEGESKVLDLRRPR